VSILAYLLFIALSGLVVGALARPSLPGPDPLSIWETILLGVAGSLAAGLIWWAISGRNGGGFVLSVLCSSVILYFIRRSRGGSLTRPGGDPGDRV
jgi:uncharacterized membrane protein YeaQ/YmgE (transglycosylase-associated protein family)